MNKLIVAVVATAALSLPACGKKQATTTTSVEPVVTDTMVDEAAAIAPDSSSTSGADAPGSAAMDSASDKPAHKTKSTKHKSTKN